MASQSTQLQVNTPFDVGSVSQVQLSETQIGLSLTIAASSENNSEIVLSGGYKSFCVGLTSSQDGELSIQRYIDREGNVPQDNNDPFTISFVATQPVSLNVSDGKPFQSIKITVSNSSGSIATISNFLLLFQAN